MRVRTLLLIGLLTVMAAALNAHDLFIKLNSYFVEPNARVRIPVLNGTFSLSENAIAPDRVLDLSLVSGGSRKRLATTLWTAAGDTTWLTLQTGASGSYVVGVSTRHRELSLSAVDFNEYLEHDGIPDVLEARRRSGELARDVVERYHKHVKAVFQVGENRSDDFTAILGYPAEIVPLDNPYSLGPRGTLRVRCLVDGKPVARQFVIAGGESSAGVIRERSARTGADGVAGFELDGPGKWYVKFIHMVRSSEGGIDYESKWATLTFEVR
jgi:hypothetical protein